MNVNMWEKKGWRWKYAWILKQSRRITCSSSFTKMNVFPYIRRKETYKQQEGRRVFFFARAFFKAQLRNMYACASTKLLFYDLRVKKRFFQALKGTSKKTLGPTVWFCQPSSWLLKKDVLSASSWWVERGYFFDPILHLFQHTLKLKLKNKSSNWCA